MTRRRGRRAARGRGFVSRVVVPWYRRLRWIRRAVVLALGAGGVLRAVRGGDNGGRTGDDGLGRGGAARPAPVGGPPRPSPLVAAVTAPTSADRQDGGSEADGSAPRHLGSTQATATLERRGPMSASATGDPADAGRAWVEHEGTDAPAGYPVKANVASGIFHVPGGAFYDRTNPERWYRSPADAEADGFRAAKR